MKHKLFFIMVLLLAVLLAACVTTPPTSTPTATATIPPTSTPTSTPTPTPTPLPDPEWSFFKKVDVEVKDIRKLAFDQDGFLWAIGYGGVMRWNLEDETRVTYTETDGLSGDELRSILVDKHNVPWVASDTEIFSFDGETWVSYPYPSTGWTRSFFEGANNDLWLCATDGLHQFNGTEWITHGVHNGMPADKCYDLAIDADGYPWVISADNTLSHYTGQWENIESPANFIELYENVIDYQSTIHISPTGDLWVTGLYHASNVNIAQNTWNLYSLPEREGAITAFTLSSSGTPWMAHLYKGKTSFRAFNGTDWPIIMQSGYENGLDMTFDTAIADPDGAIWFIGEECFIRTMQNGWTVFMDAHAAWNSIHNHGVFSTDGTLYFSAPEGILALGESREDVSTLKVKVEGLTSNVVYDIQASPDGNIYIINLVYPESGDKYIKEVIQVYDGSSWETIHEFYREDDFIQEMIVDRDGTLWMVGEVFFYYYDGTEVKKVINEVDLSKEVGFPLSVRDIIEDNQNAILATNWEGTYIWDGVQWTLKPTGGTGDNFRKEGFYDVFLSPQGILWFTDWRYHRLFSYHDGIWADYPQVLSGSTSSYNQILDVQFNQHDQPIVLTIDYHEYVVYEYDGHSWNQIDLNLAEEERVKILYHQDTLWVGTKEGGLYYRVDSENGIGKWEHLSNSNWEGGTHVRLIALGVENDIWVVTQESINFFRDGEWIYFPQGEDGFIGVACFALAPDGSVWFGSFSQGVARYGMP